MERVDWDGCEVVVADESANVPNDLDCFIMSVLVLSSFDRVLLGMES